MKKKQKWSPALRAVLCVLLAAGILWMERTESQGIFYRVYGGQKEMVILGSIHAGSREMYPMSSAIREAMSRADALVFECDTESDAAVLAMQRLMYYPQGDELSSHISAACYEQLTAVAAKTGYSMEQLDHLKPWAITSMLSVQSLSAQTGGTTGSASELGVEKQVRKQAGSKTLCYLETAEEQLQLMDRFSPALQEYLLADACNAVLHPETGGMDELTKWPAWWAEGNAQAFAETYRVGMAGEQEPQLAQEYHEALITTRNRRMAQTLREWLEAGEQQSYFVTVGLMHLVLGEDSILTELENMGYTIEQIIG